MRIVGSNGPQVLFSSENNATIIDIETNEVVETGTLAALTASASWSDDSIEISQTALDLASAELTNLDVVVLAAGARLYTIPKGAQNEAKKALEWHKEHKRGGTPVGLNTARTLAKGGQIGIEKVRHIAKYFPRHEVDKKAKGYEPGEPNFPSNGRIAWALWGGDTAWRWARAIVERENKKALRADGYATSSYQDDEYDYVTDTGYQADLDAFRDELNQDTGAVEFIARLRMDGSGIDRLYKIDDKYNVQVWDGGFWHTLDGVNPDLASYDVALDSEDDTSEFSHVEIDPETALFLSACFQEDANRHISLFDINHDEAEMFLKAASELDMDFMDSLVAVGTPAASPAGTPSGPVTPNDGQYTPAERSAKAKKQVRDKTGRFATQGSRVVVGGDLQKGRGNIVGIDPAKQSVRVKLDSGSVIDVPALATEPEVPLETTQQAPINVTPLDTTGILGEPRTPIDQPGVHIPGTLPSLTPDDLGTLLGDWPAWVTQQRQAYSADTANPTAKQKQMQGPVTGKDQVTERKSDYMQELEKLTGIKMQYDPYKHPMLEKFLNKKVKGSDGKYYYPNKIYYQPIARGIRAAADAPGKSKELTPETSDVQPVFFAIVSESDPSAVYELVALVPASSSSNAPATYIRRDEKWLRDESVLADIKSPTPPPVVPLDAESLKSVIEQVDGKTAVQASATPDSDFLTVLWAGSNVMFLTAAGGIDRNRGNAERLRRYWVHGKGALKIRWGQKGDWARCVRHLAKYLGPRAKGYCQLRHKEALGFYTATHAKKDRARHNSATEFIMETPFDVITMKPFTEVTDDDMKMPLDAIHITHDDLYDDTFEPDPEIVSLLEELGRSDDAVYAMLAAGGVDRNRGNAENLRRYWTIGKGGLKIRWNTPGDWTRCYRHLKKYMGPRAKGYCSLRHHEMTGMWPGDKNNPGHNKGVFSMDEIIERAQLSARAEDARLRVMTADGSGDINVNEGGAFSIPLVIPEELESGDGRRFEKGAIEIRELPLPLMWQIKSAEGHNGSVVVGRIDHMERVDGGIGNATGVFDTGAYGQEAERLVRNGFIKGVSADLDQFEASQEEVSLSDNQEEDAGKIGGDKLVITHARVMAVTLVPKPAFQECQIYLVNDEPQEENVIQDGVYVDEMDPVEASALVACGLIAGSIPVVPPRSWFDNPNLDKPTPLTVDDEGRVFGHIAAWHVDHIGLSYGTKPPRSKSKYAYFHTGVVRTDDGTDMPVGQLTLAGGHASLEASAAEAARHYDDTGSAFADVHAGEDAFGIWVSGALRPGTTPEQVRAIRASAPSGDWRPIKGALELVAVCQVNVPGFPIARARVASGAVMALVAAGANVLARIKSDPIAELAARIEKLEQLENSEINAKIEAARARVYAVREEKAAQLSAQADAAYARIHGEPKYDDAFAYISREKREQLAKKGYALPDGSYPITNEDSLKDSIQAYGRSKPGKRAAVRRHIMKRARSLDRADLIPDEWKKASASLIEEDLTDLRSRISSFTQDNAAQDDNLGKALAVESTDGAKYTPETQPRDKKGKFRMVLARLKQDLGAAGNDQVLDKIKETERFDTAGNYLEAARSAGDLLSIVDRLDTGALDSKSIENIRSSTRELGKVIANLPLPFGSETEKVSYSDLPPAMRGLINDMVKRVEDKIGKKDADQATVALKSFMSGGDLFSQSEVSAEMSKLLRLLT